MNKKCYSFVLDTLSIIKMYVLIDKPISGWRLFNIYVFSNVNFTFTDKLLINLDLLIFFFRINFSDSAEPNTWQGFLFNTAIPKAQ